MIIASHIESWCVVEICCRDHGFRIGPDHVKLSEGGQAISRALGRHRRVELTGDDGVPRERDLCADDRIRPGPHHLSGAGLREREGRFVDSDGEIGHGPVWR